MPLNPNLSDFFESGFCDAYWPAAKDPNSAAPHAQQALDLLGARPATGPAKTRVLDWRGGWGAYALHFARQGFDTILLDFCKHYMEMARALFEQAGLEFTPVLADSRETPASLQADYAVCLGCSVGFLDHEEEVRSFASLRAALKPGAKVLIEAPNLFFLAGTGLGSRVTTDAAGAIRRESHSFDFRTSVNHSVFELTEPNRQPWRQEFSQKLYSPSELGALLERAGFQVEQLLGGLDGEKLAFNSRRVVVIAEAPVRG